MPVEIDNVTHQVYVLKRPYCDRFLKRMGELFECILFTASLSKVKEGGREGRDGREEGEGNRRELREREG